MLYHKLHWGGHGGQNFYWGGGRPLASPLNHPWTLLLILHKTRSRNHGCGFGVGVSHLKETLDSRSYLSHLDFFVAVCLTFVQFILQLKLCLYTVAHLLLEEFKNFSRVILKYTITMSHNKSYSRSWSPTINKDSAGRDNTRWDPDKTPLRSPLRHPLAIGVARCRGCRLQMHPQGHDTKQIWSLRRLSMLLFTRIVRPTCVLIPKRQRHYWRRFCCYCCQYNQSINQFIYPTVQDNINRITTKEYKAQWRATRKADDHLIWY